MGRGEDCPGCILRQPAVVSGTDSKYIVAESGNLQGSAVRDLYSIRKSSDLDVVALSSAWCGDGILLGRDWIGAGEDQATSTMSCRRTFSEREVQFALRLPSRLRLIRQCRGGSAAALILIPSTDPLHRGHPMKLLLFAVMAVVALSTRTPVLAQEETLGAAKHVPTITKVDPPNWWVKLPSPMLLIHGEYLDGATVHIVAHAVTVVKQQASPNGHWALRLA
jgi:hypothetical protein